MATLTPTYTCTLSINGAPAISVVNATTGINVPINTPFTITVTSTSSGAMGYTFKYPPTSAATSLVSLSAGNTITLSGGLSVAGISAVFYISQSAVTGYTYTQSVPIVTLNAVGLPSPTLTATYSINGATPVPLTLGSTISAPQLATAVAGQSFVLTVSTNSPGAITLVEGNTSTVGQTFSTTANPNSASYTITSVSAAGNVTFNASVAAGTGFSALASTAVAVVAFRPPPTITLNSNNGATVIATQGTTVAMGVTSNSTGVLTYALASGTPSGASINASTGVVTLGSGAGTYSVLVSQAASTTGTAYSQAVQQSAGSFTAVLTTTLTASSPTSVTYTTSGQTFACPTFTSNSTGAYTYSILTGSGFASINASTGIITLTGTAGTFTVGVTQAATATNAAVTTAVTVATVTVVLPIAITVTPSTPSVVWSSGGTVNAGITSPNKVSALTYSISGSANGATIDSTTGVVTLSGYTIPSGSSTGTITVLVSQVAGGGYAAISAATAATITVTPVAPTVTLQTPSITYGSGVTYTFAATSTSPGALTYSLASTPTPPSGTSINASTGVITLGGAGACSILVTQTASGNYSAITTATAAGTLTINPATIVQTTPVITAASAQSVTYVAAAPTLACPTFTSTSTGAFTYSILTGGGFATINASTGVITLTGTAGTFTVGLTQAATSAFFAVTTPVTVASVTVSVPTIVTVTPSTPSVVWSSGGTVNASISTPNKVTAPVYSISGTANGATINSATGVVTLSGYTIPSGSSTGTITVLVSQVAGGGYAAITNATAAVITVTPNIPVISVVSYSTAFIAGGTYTFVGASTSPGALTYSLGSGPSGTVVAPNGVITFAAGGAITVLVTQAASGNYAAITTATAAGTLSVGLVAPSLTFNSGGTLPQNKAGAYTPTQSIDMSVTSSSQGLLTYSLASGAPGGTTINPYTGSLNVGGIGTITVKVSQQATSNYAAVSNVTVGIITSTTGDPVITPQGYQSVTFVPGFSLTVVAQSTSPGALHYYLGSGPASVTDEGTVSITGVGTITVLVNQDASSPFNAIVSQIAATIQVLGSGTSAGSFRSPSYIGNQSQIYMLPQDNLTINPSKLAILTRSYACATPYLGSARASLGIGTIPYSPKGAPAYGAMYLFRKPSESNNGAVTTLQCQYYGVRDGGDLRQIYTTTSSEVRSVNGVYTIYGAGLSSTSLSFTAKYVSPLITQSWVQLSSQPIVTNLPVLPYDSADLFDVIFPNLNLTGTNTSNAPVPLNALLSQLTSVNIQLGNPNPNVLLVPEVVSINAANYGTVSEVTVRYGAAIASGLSFT